MLSEPFLRVLVYVECDYLLSLRTTTIAGTRHCMLFPLKPSEPGLGSLQNGVVCSHHLLMFAGPFVCVLLQEDQPACATPAAQLQASRQGQVRPPQRDRRHTRQQPRRAQPPPWWKQQQWRRQQQGGCFLHTLSRCVPAPFPQVPGVLSAPPARCHRPGPSSTSQ